MATVLWSIGKMLGGKDFAMPLYSDIRNRGNADTRDAKTIVNDILGKLTGEGVADNGDESVYRDGETGA